MQRRLAVAVAAWSCSGLPAQTPAPTPAPAPAPAPATGSPAATDRLRALLQELRALDAAAWQERIAALEQRAAEQDRIAKAARDAARRHEEQAAAADAQAKAARE